MHKDTKKTVFLGMSGGVDSSVSAYLLKKSGYNVVGVFIQVWQPEGFMCTAKEDRLDAMRVASQLEIPFLTLNLENEYKKGVVDYMFDEYKKGRTPNPDIMCNKEVKFGAFLDWALLHGADYIATGHYAQVIHEKNETKIIRSIDTNKDQTYFLWTLTQKQLKHVLFPIGHLKKYAVRTIAQTQSLFTAPKKDSQGLCFVGNVSFKDLLKNELKPLSGAVIDEYGNTIGIHEGAILYTKGERHGFSITKKSPHDSKLFVTNRNIENNTITVSAEKPETTTHLISDKITLKNYSVTRVPYAIGNTYNVQVRYRAELHRCKLTKLDEESIVLETEMPISVTQGQSAVLYSVDSVEMCGGGIIE